MDLYEKHEALRDRFEILAFHNGSVASLAELDEKLARTVEERWGGKRLPFPTLLDATGLTYRNFSITTLGRAVLIDPAGHVVRGDAEEILAKALEALAEPEEAPPSEEAPARREAPASSETMPQPSAGKDEKPAPESEPTPAKTEIGGRVVDGDGQPVAGVRLALQWSFRGGTPSPRWPPAREAPEVVSDEEGRFAASVDLRHAPLGLVALDMPTRRGAQHVIERAYDGAAIELKLQPLVHLFGTFSDDIAAIPLTSSYAYAALPGVRMGVAEDLSRDRTFSLYLPPATYLLRFGGTDRLYLRKKLTLDAGRTEHDLGVLTLPPRPIALLYGKEPPALHVSAARGVAPTVQIEDYRGKWLLVEFWGHW